MTNYMTEKERVLIPEVIKTLLELPPELQERLIWVGQGMLLANTNHEGRQDN